MDLSDPYFGVIEVPNSTTSTRTPGYAIVPDTGYDPSKIAIQPTGRKRLAATKTLPTSGEVTSRQQAAILKHLQELDRDDGRDVKIEVPKKKEGAQGRKTTTNVARILKSEKNWGHHLADEEALRGQEKGGGQANVAAKPPATSSKSHGPSLSKQSSAPRQTQSEAQSSATISPPHDPLEDDPLLRTYVPSAPSEGLMNVLVSEPP